MSVKYGITLRKDLDCRETLESLSIYSKVDLLNETLLNIIPNYIPNKKIKYDYQRHTGLF